MRLFHQMAKKRCPLRIKTQFLRAQEPLVFDEQPHHHTFTVDGRHRAHPDIHPGTSMIDLDVAILRHEPFGNVHVRHDLDARNQSGVQGLGRRRFLLEKTVNAVP